ncbi:MAG: phosphatidylserine decarboxylase family protein [Verrucomicrobia bacterium]|nr:phosphatidylserine decarboxylase family protein [Verrucomicrobiota bacterium]
MKHAGKATQAALRIIYWTLFVLLGLLLGAILAQRLGEWIIALGGTLAGLWMLFGLFTLYFFRDPQPRTPADPDLIVAPAHGKVDLIDEVDEPEFLGGRCRRISIFLSVFDVHVQHAPVAGRVAVVKHTHGQFLNAMRTDSARYNENVFLGLESSERPGERLGVRLIAGLIARRIVPWVAVGDTVARGERISLIRFGSRVDLYLPLTVQLQVQLNTHVRGGETIVARRP